uniref:PNPLA domain-containing protein n=1 Tax=Romanomermis culicivorax TaxID=13658 RepID=A0A915I1M3_ROMCU
MHQDGGVLANNPTAIGLHECRQLWPRTPIHCVVSVGTGRMAHLPQHSTPAVEPRYSSTFDKLYQAVVSATDTEKVHTILNDLLPPNTYYRTNPYMTKSYNLDDTAPDTLDQMTLDGKLYVRKNEAKLKAIALRLMQPKTYIQALKDRINHKLACYGY